MKREEFDEKKSFKTKKKTKIEVQQKFLLKKREENEWILEHLVTRVLFSNYFSVFKRVSTI